VGIKVNTHNLKQIINNLRSYDFSIEYAYSLLPGDSTDKNLPMYVFRQGNKLCSGAFNKKTKEWLWTKEIDFKTPYELANKLEGLLTENESLKKLDDELKMDVSKIKGLVRGSTQSVVKTPSFIKVKPELEEQLITSLEPEKVMPIDPVKAPIAPKEPQAYVLDGKEVTKEEAKEILLDELNKLKRIVRGE
jgi:hypothetical protein